MIETGSEESPALRVVAKATPEGCLATRPPSPSG
jgi:hypothetical protein